MAKDADPPWPLKGTGTPAATAGHGRQVPQHRAIERDTLAGIGILRGRQRGTAGDHVAGLESGVDLLKCRQTVQEQSRADQQNERKRHLRGH